MNAYHYFARTATCAALLLFASSAIGEDGKPSGHGGDTSESAAKCPVTGLMNGLAAFGVSAKEAAPQYDASKAMTNHEWWPNRLNLEVLHQNSPMSNPMGKDFNYAEEFKTIDLDELKQDIEKVMTTSQDWWPADYGHYGPFLIRMAWHSAGTYRAADGRGGAADGAQRFAPLNSWPDNANLDKARRLLWPIKQKYGRKLSWADLMVFSGNCALESMGFETMGFAGGREDVWQPQNDIYWGPESKWLSDKRYHDKQLEKPLAATQMGLIYVNPEGPGGKPNPLAAAAAIREAFGNMAMNDEETVALIAGGHTLGKAHGAAAASKHVGPEPEAAGLAEQGLGWKNNFGKGNAEDTITSGLEGAWTSTPAQWSHDYFDNMFNYEWELTKSPGGAHQWTPKDNAGEGTVPDAHDPTKTHAPMMFTTDLALKTDPVYAKISKRFHENPAEFEKAFAKAWYKLIHRDLGPYSRGVGSLVPEPQIWQDPLPEADGEMIGEQDIAKLKAKIIASDLSVSQLVSTAWASASTFRGSDSRGGANGARLRLAPQKDWEVNQPKELAKVLAKLEQIQREFNDAQSGKTKVSLADVIVLGGCAAIEKAAKKAGHDIKVPFSPGRTDATQEMTDVQSQAVLKPVADGFRNYVAEENYRRPEEMLVDKAQLLTLTAPEMTALLGGMRVLNVNFDQSKLGVFTTKPETLTNDFFVNLLKMETKWQASAENPNVFQGIDRKTGEVQWTGSRVDLLFGSNSQLRAIAEVYAYENSETKFVNDFVAAWNKVMNLDRFDIDRSQRIGAKKLAFEAK